MNTRTFLFNIDDSVFDQFGCKGYISMLGYDGTKNMYEVTTALNTRWLSEGEVLHAYVQFKVQQ